MDFSDLFSRHKRATLLYSGGKDSLACLLLLADWWHQVDVVWVDTGNQFPEVYEHMDRVRGLVPTFITIKSNTYEFTRDHGYPVDVVPTRYTTTGQFIYGPKKFRVCSRFDCCRNNIWKPIEDYVRLTKPTCIIRGDRSSERVKAPESIEGIEFAFPLFDWTTDQVMSLIRNAPFGLFQERHNLPEGSSLDCISCMAYNVEYESRMEYLKKHHSLIYKGAVEFFKDYKNAVKEEMAELGDKE